MGAALKLFPAVLIFVYSAQDRDDLALGGQRDRAGHFRAGALGGFDNLLGALVDQLMVVSRQTDTDFLSDSHLGISSTNF